MQCLPRINYLWPVYWQNDWDRAAFCYSNRSEAKTIPIRKRNNLLFLPHCTKYIRSSHHRAKVKHTNWNIIIYTATNYSVDDREILPTKGTCQRYLLGCFTLLHLAPPHTCYRDPFTKLTVTFSRFLWPCLGFFPFLVERDGGGGLWGRTKTRLAWCLM